MKKSLKIIAIIITFIFVFCGAVACAPSPEDKKDVQKTMDIYLIAGQSNAVGYSKIVNDAGLMNPFIEELSEKDKRVTEGFTNVLYAGDSQSGSGITYHNKKEWQPLTLGMGKDSNRIGVEIGMALALSDSYTETNAMGIIKLGHGGTNLLDVLQGENFPEGNWAPPSYLETVENAGEKSGGLYREFVDFVAEQYQAAKDLGYIPNVKGFFWMQGEADVWLNSDFDETVNKYKGIGVVKVHNTYRDVFKMFMEDLRKDLSERLSSDLSEMPVFIGELSRSFAGAGNASANGTLSQFIKMQNKLPNVIPNAYIIKSSFYDMNVKDGQTGENVVVGSDMYHWNCHDITAIGQLIGESIKQNVLKAS